MESAILLIKTSGSAQNGNDLPVDKPLGKKNIDCIKKSKIRSLYFFFLGRYTFVHTSICVRWILFIH